MKIIRFSKELKENLNEEVLTPSGKVVICHLWQTAKEHGENINGSAYGSKAEISVNGKKAIYYSAPPATFDKLTDLYKELSLEISGQSSNGKREQKTAIEKALPLMDKLTTTEIFDYLKGRKDLPRWYTEAVKAEGERVKKEAEEARAKEERKTLAKLLRAQGFSLADLEKLRK